MISGQVSSEVPKVADFLGVSKSENQSSDLVVYNNEFHANESDYLYANHNLLHLPNPLAVAPPDHHSYDVPENASNLQSLTLSMGSGNKHSKCETSGENNDSGAIIPVDATPRRTLDTFGQRTSIYRGVTRFVLLYFNHNKLKVN